MCCSAARSVSGRLVEVGLGRSQDLVGRDLQGAIALIERGDLTFAEGETLGVGG
jgi:hypothetical protein